mgnify:CR=1 FL=1
MNIKKMATILATLLMGLGLAATVAVAQDHILADTKATDQTTATDAKTVSATDKDFHNRHPRYKLEAGDAFDITFELNPEFNQTVSVQPDGYISLRGIGDVPVMGQTLPQVTDTIRNAYGKILSNPLVSIVLKDFEKPYFIADGQVSKPGKYDLRGEMTLTQAVAMAGGFLDTAKHSRVLLYRRGIDGWYAAEIFNVKKMEKAGNLKEDPTLHAGDMLFVPKNGFSKIRAFIPGSSMGAFVPLTTP